MDYLFEIPVVKGEVRRGDDVSIPLTSFSYNITGFTFSGTIYPANSSTALTGGTITFTNQSATTITINVTAAQTTSMTADEYYSFISHVDGSAKKKTILKVIYKMV